MFPPSQFGPLRPVQIRFPVGGFSTLVLAQARRGAHVIDARVVGDSVSPEPLSPSVSGLLGDVAHVRQARSRSLRCYPEVALITFDRPPHRARGGHGQHLQIRSPVSDRTIQMPGFQVQSCGPPSVW
jgi:hypothetical protein